MLINQSITVGVGAGVVTSWKQDVDLSEELAKGGLCTTVELGGICVTLICDRGCRTSAREQRYCHMEGVGTAL